MNVSELLERILEISHNEVAPDTGLKQKALRWLNSAYHEILDELQPFLSRYMNKTSTVNVADGRGAMPANLYRLLKVEFDGKTLKQIESQPDLTGQTPQVFMLSGDVIQIFPSVESCVLTLTYTATQDDLTEETQGSDILLPSSLHHHLVWGALIWGSVYERGFSTQSELALFQQKWDEAKRSAKLSLANQPTKPLRVEQNADVV